MNINIKIFLLCPVPENQKPINEYLAFKENLFRKFFSQKKKKKTNFLSFGSDYFFGKSDLLLLFKNLKSTYSGKKIKFQTFFFYCSLFFFISTNIFFVNLAFLIFFFYFFQFFVYLNYLQNRFLEAKVVYEESSWYDSQIWNKPLSVIKNDHFLFIQELRLNFTNFFFY